MKKGTAILVIAAVGMPGGCAGDANERPAGDGPPTRVATVDLAIGETDGADELVFSTISGLAIDRRGRIYVADLENHEVRVFTADGRLAYRIGRRGQGPGEFQEPCCLALRNHDSTLWVRDNGNSRYVSFTLGDTSAEYGSMIRLAHRDNNRWAPVTFDADNGLIDIGFGLPDSTNNTNLVRFHLDTAGGILRRDEIPPPPADSVPRYDVRRKVPNGFVVFYLWPLFGPNDLHAHAPNGERARATSSRYSVAWYGGDGRLLRTLEEQREGPPLSAAERARAEQSIQDDMKRLSLPRGDIPFGVADRKQSLRSLYFDQEGRLWVELSVADGTSPTAHVYSPEGRLLYTKQWPARTNLSHGAARGDFGYGVQRDSLDTERVVRLRFR